MCLYEYTQYCLLVAVLKKPRIKTPQIYILDVEYTVMK